MPAGSSPPGARRAFPRARGVPPRCTDTAVDIWLLAPDGTNVPVAAGVSNSGPMPAAVVANAAGDVIGFTWSGTEEQVVRIDVETGDRQQLGTVGDLQVWSTVTALNPSNDELYVIGGGAGGDTWQTRIAGTVALWSSRGPLGNGDCAMHSIPWIPLLAVAVPTVAQAAPVADAGPARTVSLGEVAFLDGTGSTPYEELVDYIWDFDAADGVTYGDSIGAFTATRYGSTQPARHRSPVS